MVTIVARGLLVFLSDFPIDFEAVLVASEGKVFLEEAMVQMAQEKMRLQVLMAGFLPVLVEVAVQGRLFLVVNSVRGCLDCLQVFFACGARLFEVLVVLAAFF
jgi:hypothetical protein